MGLPYLLGDSDPKDPVNGWSKTWAYLKELEQVRRAVPVRHRRDDEEPGQRLGRHHRHHDRLGHQPPGARARCRRTPRSPRSRASTGSPTRSTPWCPRACRPTSRPPMLALLQVDADPVAAGQGVRQGLLLPRPGGEGRHAVDGAAGQPAGHRGVRPARVRRSYRRATRRRSRWTPKALVAAFDQWDREIGGGEGEEVSIRDASRELRLDGVTPSASAARTRCPDLNLTIERGEFIALLGPSGCGKSTALNCLAGLLPLDRRAASGRTTRGSTRCRRSSAASAWCSRTTRCSRT